jgi:hypothetical protein
MLLLAAAFPAHAQSGDLIRIRAELRDAEIAYEKSLYVYPACDGPRDEFERTIRLQAQKLGVGDFTLTATPGSAAVPASPFRIERMQFHGRGEFGDVESLLHRIASASISRVLDFETVHLRAGSGRDVSLDGTLAMACRDLDSDFFKVTMPAGRTPAEMELAMYRGRLQQLQAAAAAAKQLEERMQPRRLVDALLVLADVWGQSAVGVNDLRYTASALTLQGIALGASAKAAVEGSLRKPRFELTRLEWSPAGDCHAFTAAARLLASEESTSEALPMDMFLARDAAHCNNTTAPPTALAKRGSGPLTLHLRDVDVRALFLALNDLSPADGFIIEPDVAGRVTVDFDNVTTSEALAVLSAAGVAFATPGPLHRICRTACGEPTVKPQKYQGEPLGLSITDANVIDILRMFEQVASLGVHAPRDLKGNFSAYVSEPPWDAVFDGLLSAFRRNYTIDGTSVYIGDRAAALPLAQLSSAVSGPRSLAQPDPRKIAAPDFRLAGIGGTGGSWKAYGRVLGSSKLLFVAGRDAALLDANVAAVAADRVTLRTADGRDVVVTLP